MADIVIERKPTEEELKNFIPVGMQTLDKKYRKQRIEVEQQYVIKHKPYCSRCADLDFKDKWEEKLKEISRNTSKVDDNKIKLSLPELDVYGQEKRFTLRTKSPIIRDVVSDGVKIPKLVGHYYEYICNVRGCGRSVEVPLVDWTTEPVQKID